jgi:hypothetical protein
MPSGAVRLEGARELVRACDHAGKEIKRELRRELREGGRIVATEVERRLAPYSTRSAAGVGVSVRQRGVSVVQRLRKTTGKRPDWGTFQFKTGFLPGLESKRDEVERHIEGMLDRLNF